MFTRRAKPIRITSFRISGVLLYFFLSQYPLYCPAVTGVSTRQLKCNENGVCLYTTGTQFETRSSSDRLCCSRLLPPPQYCHRILTFTPAGIELLSLCISKFDRRWFVPWRCGFVIGSQGKDVICLREYRCIFVKTAVRYSLLANCTQLGGNVWW